MDRRVVLQLVGESMRQTGIVSGLFVSLDSAFSERLLATAVRMGVSVASIIAIACGILLEATNQ